MPVQIQRKRLQGGRDLPVHFGLMQILNSSNSCKNTTQRKMQAILVTLDKSLTGIQHDALLEARR